jgi:RND superfamily putative drug exporter
MFERLGSLTYRFRFLIVLAWLAGAAWSVLFAPSLAAEGMTDQTAFLPPGTASMEAHDALERAFPGSTSVSSAQLVFARDGGLTDADHAYIGDMAAWLTGDEAPQVIRDAVAGVETAASRPELESLLRSEDGELEMVNVNLDVVMAGAAGDAVVAALREQLAATAPGGLAAHVTGAGGIGSDYLAAIVSGTDSTTIVTIILVVVILLLIYRAPLAAMVPLITIGAAFIVARGTLGILALLGWKVSSLIDTFIVVLIFGVGTDYAIFLISRFREEVAKGDWHDAARTTVGRIGAVISASAATVIVGLGAMAFGDFGMIQTTGPALAVGVAITLVAGLTLTPALLGIFGHYLFWPRHTHAPGEGRGGGFFGRLAAMVARRPGLVTAVLLVGLLVPALYLPQMRTNFDVLAELPAGSDARAGFDAVAEHLGRGEVFQGTGVVDGGAGADLLAPASLARTLALMQELQAEPGVQSVTSLVTPDGDGRLPDAFRPSWQLAEMADAFDEGGDAEAPADAESILDPDVTDGLDSMATYLGELGAAFPDVAYGPELRAATAAVATAQDQVRAARDGAVVSTQLRALASAMASPAAMAGDAGGSGDAGDSIAVIGDYLDELAAAFPDVRALPDHRDATAAVASLEDEVTIGAAVDLAGALRSLAAHFDERPDATLFPESLAGTDAAKEARREIERTFEELPASLDALAAVFVPRADDVFLPTGLGGDDGETLDDAIAAFVSDDRTATRFYLSTSDDPYSQAAFATVARAQAILEAAAPGFGSGAAAHLGGTTAQFADVQAVLASDFTKVGIITVLGILLVLVLLLRAIVAPLYLVGTVLLSCATALGLSSWFFQEVLGHPGVSFYLPILVFVLLVAIGSDYNIFLVSRIREESAGREIHEGIRIASARTGAVITSAGLILAGTFAAMMTADLAVLFQVGLAVAVGVLIDTFLVRSILVPAITTLFGERAWWPSGWAVRRSWPIAVTVPAPGVPAAASRRRLGVALAIAALVPLLVGGALAWSLNDRDARLDRVSAAVVDLDGGATMPGPDGAPTPLDLGAEIADRLVASEGGDAFTWVAEPDPEAARAGLEDGTYGAVLTVPGGFSAAMAAVVRGDAAAEPARLHLETDDATGYGLGPTARAIVAALAAETGRGVTAEAVDRVLLAVSGAGTGMAGAAADVDGLAARSAALADDAASTSTVADELVSGLTELADGMAAAGDGVGDLAGAVRSLADGNAELADGAERLGSGMGSAAAGADDLAGGVELLADGLGELAAGTAALPSQVAALAAGTRGVADGTAGVAAGARSLADGLAALAAGTTGLGRQTAQLHAGAGDVATGAAGVAAGIGASATGAHDLATGAAGYASSVEDYTNGVAALSAGCAALGGTDPLCAELAGLAGAGGQVAAGADGIAAGASDLATGLDGLAAGAADLSAGAAALEAGTGALAASTPQLEAGIAGSATGANDLAGGAAQVAAGAEAVATGAAALAASMPALADGVSGAADAAEQLATGADTMAAGMAKLAAGAMALGSGARTAAGGASRLADGTAAAADGAAQIADAMDEATEGARLVATGLEGVAEDGTAAADDAAVVASDLEAAGDELPAYAEPAREAVASLVADPVAVESVRLHPLATEGAALAPLLLALSLWIGALASFLVLPAFLGRRDPARWWRRALAGYGAAALLGAVQAVLLVLAIRFAVGVEVAHLPQLVAVAVLAALAFAAVNQALVALLDARGWLVSLVLLALQVAAVGALDPAATAPELLQVVRLALPLTFAVDAFRALVAGGGADLAVAVGGLVAWGVAAFVVTLAVAYRSAGEPESVTPDETALAGA